MLKENERLTEMRVEGCDNGYIVHLETKVPSHNVEGVFLTKYRKLIFTDKKDIIKLLEKCEVEAFAELK